MKIIQKTIHNTTCIKPLIFGLGILFILFQSSCCGTGDDEESFKRKGDPNMIVYIFTSPNNVFYNDSFSFTLIKPEFNYTKIVGMDKSAFPLLIDARELDFLVSKNGGGPDTLTIQYDVEMKHFAGTKCLDPYYYPKAKIKTCFTRNKLFNVVSYR